MRFARFLCVVLILFSLPEKAPAQITESGWQIISSHNFDLYLPKSSNLNYTRILHQAEWHLQKCEELFDYHLNENIRLVLSRNPNIVQVPVSLNNSKSTEVEFDRHTGYIVSNLDEDAIVLQIKNTIVQILINDLLYGKTLQERLQNNTLLQLPPWFSKGLAAYCNEYWLSGYDGKLRNWFTAHRNVSFNALLDADETLAGCSFWRYVSDQYGEQNIPNLLYIIRLSRSVENGLFFVYGKGYPEVFSEWSQYYKNIFSEIPSTPGIPVRSGKVKNLEQMTVSPDGKWLAGVRVSDDDKKILLYNLFGSKYYELATVTPDQNPVLRWMETTKSISLVYNITDNGEKLVFFNTGSKTHTGSFTARDFDKLIAFDIDASRNMVFYGISKSQSFLLYYSSLSKKLTTLGKDLVLADVRLSDSAVYAAVKRENEMAVVRYGTVADTLLKIPSWSCFRFVSFDSATLQFTNNANGFNQLYTYDTGTHAFTSQTAFTHYYPDVAFAPNNNHVYYAVSDGHSSTVMHTPEEPTDTGMLPASFYYLHPRGTQTLHPESKVETENTPDTSAGANAAYYFLNGFNEAEETEYTHILDSLKQVTQKSPLSLSFLKNYELTFSTLKVSFLQLDNSNYFNMLPLMPMHPNGNEQFYYYNYLKSEFAIKDVLNKYQFMGGFRLSTALGGGYDSYLKMQKKYKRYELNVYTYFYQKKFLVEQDRFIIKQQIQNTGVSYDYKLASHWHVKGEAYGMTQWNNWLSTENASLRRSAESYFVGGLIGELYYSRIARYSDFIYRGVLVSLAPQLYYNTAYAHLNNFTRLSVKYYKPLYRRITWSNALQVNYSAGREKVLNILGGVDNWAFARFDAANQFSQEEQYLLRNYAGSVRGFRQNARNGANSFCLNTELRIPVLSMLSRWPTERDWLRNLLLIPFFDIGSAWNGTNLFSRANNYTTRIFDYATSAQNIAQVQVRNFRQPVIAGMGMGINTRLFGYNIRFDMAWGMEDGLLKKPMYMLSYGTNF